MQERYLGDSHDYLKYALLRELYDAGFGPLALAWYLTKPETVDAAGNSDGEKRHHLTGAGWQELDPAVHAEMHRYSDPKDRSIPDFEDSGLLPGGTVFTGYNPPSEAQRRAYWWSAVLRDCAASETVFCDPDNGFIVKSATGKRKAKYALYNEVQSLYLAGKTTISIQFARQCDPVRRARDVRATLTKSFPECADIPVLRGRVAPNILFLFMARPQLRSALIGAMERLTNRSNGRLELIQ